MATPTYNETLDTMYATTWVLRRKSIVDQAFEATPFWYTLSKKGKRKTQTGGRRIECPLNYGKNETVTYVGKGGTVTIESTDPVTIAYYDWKYLTGHIVRYFKDFQQNRGKAALINKVNSDIDNLQSSLIDRLEEDLFGDGTGIGGLAIDGLDKYLAETQTSGTVGGLNRATYGWWRANTKDMSGEPTSIYLRKRMNSMFNDCGRYGKGVSRFPDLIVCAQGVYELYEDECLEISRIVINDKKLADLGFGDLAYKGRPITWSPSCKSGSMYILNTNFLEWVADPIENFTMGEWLPIVNQPRDRIAHVMTVGNLICSNLRKQGVIYDITETGA